MEENNQTEEMIPKAPGQSFDVNKFTQLLKILKERQDKEYTFED